MLYFSSLLNSLVIVTLLCDTSFERVEMGRLVPTNSVKETDVFHRCKVEIFQTDFLERGWPKQNVKE